MKRLVLILLFLVSAACGLSALSITDVNPLDSPLSSVAYTGRFSDMFANPAALSLMETSTGPFAFSASWADDLDASLFGHDSMPLLQNQHWNLQASFIARYVALTAFFGTDFERAESDEPAYDIHSSLRIEVDMAYSIPHFSIGMRLSGGNKMIRRNRIVDSLSDIFANAWFSPFERESGSESFDVGVGAIGYIGPLSVGIYVGEFLTLRDDNLYFGWDAMAESTTVAISLGPSRFTDEGDLRFFRPRCSLSMTGLVDEDTRSVEIEGELTFQLLPESSVTFAASYLEESHMLFAFRPENAFVSFFLRGEGSGFSGSIGLSFKATDFSVFAPSLVFSYIS